jgi:preprotein translocase SecE subunit
VARNRKRAKERRARRTDGGNGGRRVAASGAEPAPDPIEHATPDVELADAQLAVGRAGPIETPEDELEFEQEELESEAVGGPPGGGGRRRSPNGQEPGGPGRGGAGELAMPSHAPAQSGASLLARLIGFLQGSWRELQRVQWPDRRQVAQATGVVIGFVIVAGVFLGLCDLAFSHLMNFILK